MSWYRRWRQPGGVWFFTVVTYNRRRILTSPRGRRCLRHAMDRTGGERPFETLAIVLLPDHLHCVWRLPPDDTDFSTRWRLIKTRFTQGWLHSGGREPARTDSRARRGEHAIWQRRFWEHWIRDETDFKRHVDYVHWNPVKHGFVQRAGQWPHSTFARYLRQGEYGEDWGQTEPKSLRGWTAGGE